MDIEDVRADFVVLSIEAARLHRDIETSRCAAWTDTIEAKRDAIWRLLMDQATTVLIEARREDIDLFRKNELLGKAEGFMDAARLVRVQL